MLELQQLLGCFLHQIIDGILVAQPIAAADRVGLNLRSDKLALRANSTSSSAGGYTIPQGFLAELEKKPGKTAISSVQAGFWAALRRIGLDGRQEGYGRLLSTWDFAKA